MEKITEIEPVFVEFIPEELDHGKLYISERFEIAIHLCACGCGVKSVTPLGNDGWRLLKNGTIVSLQPSIGNFKGDKPSYHAHYFITRNKVNFV